MPSNITRDQIIERAVKLCELEGSVDVVKIAEGLGIDVFAIENGDDFDADMAYDPITGTFQIEVNQNHPFTRQRFSIAHELAHYVLHQDNVKKQGTINRIRFGSQDYDKHEAEADKLAAEILIPEKSLKEYLGENKVVTAASVMDISQKFRVSIMMVILRLKGLSYNVPYIEFA